MSAIRIVSGDRSRDLVVVLKAGSGVLDLSQATSVKARFRARRKNTTLFEQTCTISDASIGQVTMAWPADWEDHIVDSSGNAWKTKQTYELQFTATIDSKDATATDVVLVSVLPRFSAVA
jgi:hypothetical protein